eukprot:scaffold83528_cov50-Cyclotella_meneghiniana.AAC.1
MYQFEGPAREEVTQGGLVGHASGGASPPLIHDCAGSAVAAIRQSMSQCCSSVCSWGQIVNNALETTEYRYDIREMHKQREIDKATMVSDLGIIVSLIHVSRKRCRESRIELFFLVHVKRCMSLLGAEGCLVSDAVIPYVSAVSGLNEWSNSVSDCEGRKQKSDIGSSELILSR